MPLRICNNLSNKLILGEIFVNSLVSLLMSQLVVLCAGADWPRHGYIVPGRGYMRNVGVRQLPR